MEMILKGQGARPRARWRYTFLLKVLALVTLVSIADRFFCLPGDAGATIGLFAFALLAAVLALRPDVRRNAPALAAAAAASWFAAALIDDPGPLALAMFWGAICLAVLLPRVAQFGNGARWLLRLALFTLSVPAGPIRDARRVAGVRSRGAGGLSPMAAVRLLAVPVLGTSLFLALFARANPLIAEAVERLDPLASMGNFSFLRLLFWLALGATVWRILSARFGLATPFSDRISCGDLPGISTASVTLSLLAFNALFAVQNGLDLAFLWSGAPLPDGMTLAAYAHRGAYPLIGTALLAGAFVLATTRPGSAVAQSPQVRSLVHLWIGQNLLLVASTMLRTIDYIEAYLLTELRIQALVWMALVAAGLALICIRLAYDRSTRWLINANLLVVSLVLSASTWIDYDRIAAGWNVNHAREVGGAGARLDLCYLRQMDDAALLPLIDLESRSLPPGLHDRVRWLRNDALLNLRDRQAGWNGWTWRGARRLAAAEAEIRARRLPVSGRSHRACDGALPTQPPTITVPPASPRPLPAAAAR